MPTLPALEFLTASARPDLPPAVVCFGEDDFLRRLARVKVRETLFGAEDDFSSLRMTGKDASLADVLDALRTVSLFGSQRSLVLIEDADDFVSQYRGQLETYLEKPSSVGILILDVRTWAKTTRLYKLLDKVGLQIDCSASKPAALRSWLVKWSSGRHKAKLDPDAADVLLEIIGPELGLLDQELAKLAPATGEGARITASLVQEMVGGWRTKTTWDMLDAALAGDAREALQQLDRLLSAGEHPVALLGPIGFSLRRFAAAARIIERLQSAGRRTTVREALTQAGVKSFVMAKSESQLRQLGPQRASKLDQWLLKADLDLKGESRLAPRVVLEALVCRLSKAAMPAAQARR